MDELGAEVPTGLAEQFAAEARRRCSLPRTVSFAGTIAVADEVKETSVLPLLHCASSASMCACSPATTA